MEIRELLARVQATQERFDAREPERREAMDVVERHGVLYADTPERVSRRLGRLNADWGLARALERTPPGPTSGRSLPLAPESFGADVLGLERLMGRNDLIDVGFLEAGALAARAVGRITVRGPGGKYGTGFLVAPGLLMTNHHVLRDAGEAGRGFVEFNYQAGLDGLPLDEVEFLLEPARLFWTDAPLDVSVVAVAPRSRQGGPLAGFGWLPLIAQEGKVLRGELVNIIQHPNGEPKQLAIRENQIVDLLEHFLHYRTDTAPGSSGSPVFNDQWEVVALHHSGVPRRDEQGRYLTVDGSLWTQDMGEDQLAWIANEGVRVSRILAALRSQPPAAGEAATLLAGLEQRPPTALAAGPPATATASGPGAVTELLADGSAAFTIPLRVTVGLGPAAPTVTPAAANGHLSAAPAAPAPAASATAESPQLRGALVALELGRQRPYYDAAADTEARVRYYGAIDPDDGDPAALFAALSILLTSTHVPQPRYEPLRMVYPWVDLHPDRRLRSIYSGAIADPEQFIHEDAAIESARAVRRHELLAREASLPSGALEAELVALEAALPYNCEHVVPQSWFTEREPMRGDLHHLFACESRCNSFRSNIPYFDFPDFEETVRDACGRRDGDRFEPVSGKGPIARATLYFLLRYVGTVGDAARELQLARLPMLLAWDRNDPVGDYERHRNMAIAELQGNRNPLIDHPEWTARIDFAAGFGATPVAGP